MDELEASSDDEPTLRACFQPASTDHFNSANATKPPADMNSDAPAATISAALEGGVLIASGTKEGMVFKAGAKGLGYYSDSSNTAVAVAEQICAEDQTAEAGIESGPVYSVMEVAERKLNQAREHGEIVEID